jgi:hypothetical protein
MPHVCMVVLWLSASMQLRVTGHYMLATCADFVLLLALLSISLCNIAASTLTTSRH